MVRMLLMVGAFIQFAVVFATIYKSSLFMKYAYRRQKNERLIAASLAERDALLHELYDLKSHASIKTEALKRGMLPIDLKKINRL